jgi:hypothetical protein
VLISHIYALSKKKARCGLRDPQGASPFRLRQPCDQNSCTDHTRRQRLAGFAFGHSPPHQLTRLSCATASNHSRHSCHRLRGTHLLVALLPPVRAHLSPRPTVSVSHRCRPTSPSLRDLEVVRSETPCCHQSPVLTCPACQDIISTSRFHLSISLSILSRWILTH